MDQKYLDQINEIMDYFDFAEVAKTMKALNWCWYPSTEAPNEPEIRTFARNQLTSFVKMIEEDKDTSYVCCGGFKSSVHNGFLKLEFVVSSWDTTDW